ncbi:DUF4114 domain-containing protein [Winogradskyella haliclonae]|uniref:DUF4114 domain-containing protein n=1 Tax=Winogradskyella haliclonae TaxID=2048558 RepID=A0ABQ2BUL4_9FLAO|nr:DUF4114 domain-containing protein [Winogradskyella haliclonae]GGI56171.1 hypothetical protein GCM10011444_04800 [Winogradskyella haliclonae]
MNLKKYYLTFLTLFTIVSCSKPDDDTNLIENEEAAIDVLFREGVNNSRLQLINRSILAKVPLDYVSGRLNNANAEVTNQQPYFWTWVARVNSPIINGELLSATHCTIKNNKAYVSYHKQGNTHLGSIEILDITDPANPILLQQIDFLNADINAITAESNGTIWAAGSHKNHGATVYKIDAGTQSFERINLSNSLNTGISASANGIAITNNYVLVSAGKTHGGQFTIDKNTLEIVYVDAYSDCKYVGVNGTSDNAKYASLITGDVATIKTGTVNSFVSSNSYSVGNIVHTNVEEAYRGKNTLVFDPYNSDRVFVAMAEKGFKAYNVNSGVEMNHSKGTMLLEGNTNAITLDDDYMYIANGADGIAIADHAANYAEVQPFFVWDMEEQPASANYITAQNDWVFVCKGQGGFNILYKQDKASYMTVSPYNDSGTPITMEEDEVICSTLLPNLFNDILPEQQNAITSHPEYFAHPAKNIHIKETAEVTLTFVSEGAGYKNTLGYYTYNINNPPQTVDDLIKVVVFPNASAQNSGGELIPGNTLKLLGTFEADTIIGFFVIADGWRNNQITEGFYTQHTNAILNNNDQQQALIFHDSTCNSTIICFEDISVPNGDKDFNDAIFQIQANPSSAIDTSEYYQIQ